MTRSLGNIAAVVTSGTLISKIGGLIRQLVIAGTFGVGAAYDAYNYAYILPGFCLILLGGINGPFHNAIVSVLSRKSKREASHVLCTINTLTSTGLILITSILLIAADPIINIVGPGLSPEIHKIAVIQLQIMAPISLLAGLIGIGFGSLNAHGEFFIPAISPVLSSLVIITFVGIFWFDQGAVIESKQLAVQGGVTLAIATLIGAFMQWLIQIPALKRKGISSFKLSWDWRHPGVKEVLKIIGPATLSSGMLQINVFTDLFFASGIIGAAAGLSYANFIIQAPLGLISNALLIPLLPTFSKLTHPKDQEELIARLRQGLMLSTASMIAVGAIFMALGTPIVTLIYSRGAFEGSAIELVAGILIAYGFGMPFYLGRDLLVRVFYALGDSITPFRLSVIGIVLNVFFDWLLLGGPTPSGNQLPFNFGAPGLVIATVVINCFTCTALLGKLNSRLSGLPLKDWAQDGLKLLFSGFASGCTAWIINTRIQWPFGFISQTLDIGLSIGISIYVFFLLGQILRVKEVGELIMIFRKKFIRLPK